MKTLMNGKTEKSEIARIIAFILICILPLLLIIKGIFRIINGELFTFAFVILFFITPLLIVLGSYNIIRNNNISAGGKSFLCVLTVIVLTVITFFIVIYGTFSRLESYTDSSAIVKYEEDYFDKTSLPQSNEFGNYSKFEYYIFKSVNIIADPCAKTVICKYDVENYQIETTKLYNNYVMQNKPIGTTEPNVNIDDYEFKMLSDEVYFEYFPKYIGFIGTNDITKEIIYIYYNNVELDYITSTEDFILEECGFKLIR